MVHVLTSLWKENMYLASAWRISCSDVTNVLTQLKQHLQKFCRVQIEKMEHCFYSY